MKLPWTKKETFSMTMNPYGGLNSANYYGIGQSALSIQAGVFAPAQKPVFKGKVVERQEPVFGWRSYSLGTEGTLMGARQEWKSRKFSAVCTPAQGMSGAMYAQYGVYYPSGAPRTDPAIAREWLRENHPDLYEALSARGNNEEYNLCVSHLEKGTCECGVWARFAPADGHVVARCMAYGTVAEDAAGNWRASDVQIESLYLVKQKEVPFAKYMDWERMGFDLFSRYDVPVKVIESVTEITPA